MKKWKVSMLTAVALSAAVSRVSFGDVKDNLLVVLPFDGNTNDATANQDHFQPAGDPAYFKFGTGFIGTGSYAMTDLAYVTSAGSAATNGASVLFGTDRSFSVSFWTQINGHQDVAYHNDPAFISNKAWASGGNIGWVVDTDNDGRLEWNYTESGLNRSDYDGPPGTLDDGNWHHVVTTFERNILQSDGVTYKGSIASYIDGLLVNRTTSNSDHGDLDAAGWPTNIGQDGTGAYPDGHWLADIDPDTGEIVTLRDFIDDVGIWDRVLSSREVSQIFSEGLKGNSVVTIIGPPPSNHWAKNGSGDWNSIPNWSDNIVPNGVDAVAGLTDSITSHQTVYTDTDITLGTLSFDSLNTYVLTGSGTLTMKTSFGNAIIGVLKGSHKINLPLTLANNTDINVAASSTLTIADPLTLASGITVNKNGPGTLDIISTQNAGTGATLKINAGTVNLDQNGGSNLILVVGGAALNFNANQTIKSLNLGANAAVQMRAGANKVIQTSSLTFAGTTGNWQGQLDLNDNDLIVQADAATRASVLAAITDQIGTARNAAGGKWTGNGITSSAAKTNATGITGLAAIINENASGEALYTNFDGATVDKNAILVKYTYNGDTDLNGKVDADDYFHIDKGFIQGLKGYVNGDLDYNGSTDADDYFLADSAFVQQSNILAVSPASATPVPEPSTLGLLSIAGLAMLRRQRRAK